MTGNKSAPPQKHWALSSPGLADQYRHMALAACEVLALDPEETSPDDIREAVREAQARALEWFAESPGCNRPQPALELAELIRQRKVTI